MLTPKYSGKESKEFWEIINNLPEDKLDLMYTFAVSLQNLEDEVLRVLTAEVLKEDMLPCPFCGGNDIEVQKNVLADDNKDEHWCECDCGATSQMGTNKITAIILWNTRRVNPKA